MIGIPPAKGAPAMLLAAIATAAAVLGGATERSVQGAILVLIGACLYFYPPRSHLGVWPGRLFLALLGIGLLAFLPAGWFATPEWRLRAGEHFGIALGPFRTPSPWLTFESLVLLCAGIGWFSLACDRRQRQSRTALLRGLAAGITFFAALSLYLKLKGIAWPFPDASPLFGPFPNRNQTGHVLALGALLCSAFLNDALRKQRWRGLGWAGALAVIFPALVLAYSRAAILLAFLCIFVWLLGIALVRRSAPKLAITAALGIALFSLLLLGGGELSRRIFSGTESPAEDLRVSILKAGIDFASGAPWLGIGLGNFEPLFTIAQHPGALSSFYFLHPESDWLWLLIEMGWPALLIALLLLGLLFAKTFPFGRESGWRFRAATASAGLLLALHGLMDVSGHRLGSVLPSLLAFGMAMHPMETQLISARRRGVFRAGGLALAIVGLVWLVAGLGEWPLPGRLARDSALEAALRLNKAGDFAATEAVVSRALRSAPMDWELYYHRAVARAYGNGDPREALADFRRARFLDPATPELPWNEGLVWLRVRPMFALQAWQEAIRRGGARQADLFKSMMMTHTPPLVRRGLAEIGLSTPELTTVYFDHSRGADFHETLTRLLADDPELDALSPGQKRILFQHWFREAKPEDRLRLAEKIENHPKWRSAGWQSLAAFYGDTGDFRRATELSLMHAPVVALPQGASRLPLEKLRAIYYQNPADYSAAYALYRAELENGDKSSVMRLLEQITRAGDCPDYFFQIKARAHAEAGEWEPAWKAVKAAGQATGASR